MGCMRMLNIAYTVDHNYIKYLYVSLLSLLRSNETYDIVIHVISHDIDKSDEKYISDLVNEHGQKVLFHVISDIDRFRDKVSAGYGVEVYLRLFLPVELEGVSRVLFLDADTIVQDDISQVFDIGMDGMALAACLDGKIGHNLLKSRNDIFGRTDDLRYFNAGVMLWNLDYIRDNSTFDDYLRVMDLFGNRLFYNDQDILNYLFAGRIRDFGSYRYNYMTDMFGNTELFDEQLRSAAIIHYAGCNPWKTGKSGRLDNIIWWEIAKQTPFYDDIVEDTLHNTAATINESENKLRIYRAYSEFKLNRRSLKDCDAIKNSKSITVYGAGAWGRLLIEELGEESSKIKHIVDKKVDGELNGHSIEKVETIKIDDSVDLVIITPYKYTEQIRKELETMISAPMISIVELFDS